MGVGVGELWLVRRWSGNISGGIDGVDGSRLGSEGRGVMGGGIHVQNRRKEEGNENSAYVLPLATS